MRIFKKILNPLVRSLDRTYRCGDGQVSLGGDYPDQRFLVIRRNNYGVGLMSYFTTCLGWIGYAKKHKMIPVVDLKRYETIYHNHGSVVRRNAWEYFFAQPAGYGLDRILHAAAVQFVSNVPIKGEMPDVSMSFFSNENGVLDYWRDLVRECIVVKDVILRLRNEPLENALAAGRVLGVLARGTDYVRMKPTNHPVQPAPDDFYRRISAIEAECGAFAKIFLVTEDSAIVADFQRHYGDRLILSLGGAIQYSGNGWVCDSRGVVGDVLRGRQYLRNIIDLSRCHYLVMGRTSGAVAAMLFAPATTPVYVFDLGSYD